MRIRLIVRPRDRMPWMEEIRAQVSRLRAAGHEIEPRLTFEGGDATRFAREAGESAVDLLIAAGGDGTMNEVVNGVAQTDWRGPVALIPLGTANDFALGLGVPEEVPTAFDVAVEGSDREVDLVRVNDRYFVNVSTGGVAAQATGETPSDTKQLLGPLAYLVTGVQKLPELEPTPARFTTPDGEAYDGDVMMYAVGNGRRTGAGSLVTPDAELADGELDVMIVPGMTRMEFMALAPRIRSGTHVDHPEVTYFRTERLTVECGHDLAVNADGESVSGDEYEYEVTGDRLVFRVP
ncbi:MAG: YegS/Rv2252/BmrU family lipid kinase [Longimicrobiales bacterium]|nr:YegS/Rv2252/BmrU family lipid kinase [Longimicrobiales bacterium]